MTTITCVHDASALLLVDPDLAEEVEDRENQVPGSGAGECIRSSCEVRIIKFGGLASLAQADSFVRGSNAHADRGRSTNFSDLGFFTLQMLARRIGPVHGHVPFGAAQTHAVAPSHPVGGYE